MRVLVGLISDTHGLVRPEVFQALDGVERILHAGDVGDDVLTQLRAIAPVNAVFGNTDAPGTPGLVKSLHLEIAGLTVHVSHGHELGSPTPDKLIQHYDTDIIVFGHTHKPLVQRPGRQLVVNPGAAGPRRFNLKPSVARLTIVNGRADAAIVWL
jgi:putative phosphoesterase